MRGYAQQLRAIPITNPGPAAAISRRARRQSTRAARTPQPTARANPNRYSIIRNRTNSLTTNEKTFSNRYFFGHFVAQARPPRRAILPVLFGFEFLRWRPSS
jgi:hypothetical protein